MAQAVAHLLAVRKLCGAGRSGEICALAFGTNVGLRSPVLGWEWRAKGFDSLPFISYNASTRQLYSSLHLPFQDQKCIVWGRD